MKVNVYIGNIYKCLEKDDKLTKKSIQLMCRPFFKLDDEFLEKQQLYKKEALLIEMPDCKYVDLDNIDSIKEYKKLLQQSELYYPEEFGIMRICPMDNDDLFVDEWSLKPYLTDKNPISLKKLIKENKRH